MSLSLKKISVGLALVTVLSQQSVLSMESDQDFSKNPYKNPLTSFSEIATPKLSLMAHLAQASYKTLDQDWACYLMANEALPVFEMAPADLDFRALAFRVKDPQTQKAAGSHKYVISIRGTVPSKFDNLLSDVSITDCATLSQPEGSTTYLASHTKHVISTYEKENGIDNSMPNGFVKSCLGLGEALPGLVNRGAYYLGGAGIFQAFKMAGVATATVTGVPVLAPVMIVAGAWATTRFCSGESALVSGKVKLVDSCRYTIDLIDQILQKDPLAEFELTGHSLGAFIAGVIGTYRGIPTYAFNPPGGQKQFLENYNYKLAEGYESPSLRNGYRISHYFDERTNASIDFSKSPVINFIRANDIVGILGSLKGPQFETHVGKNFFFPDYNKPDIQKLKPGFANIDQASQHDGGYPSFGNKNHSIQAWVDDMDLGVAYNEKPWDFVDVNASYRKFDSMRKEFSDISIEQFNLRCEEFHKASAQLPINLKQFSTLCTEPCQLTQGQLKELAFGNPIYGDPGSFFSGSLAEKNDANTLVSGLFLEFYKLCNNKEFTYHYEKSDAEHIDLAIRLYWTNVFQNIDGQISVHNLITVRDNLLKNAYEVINSQKYLCSVMPAKARCLLLVNGLDAYIRALANKQVQQIRQNLSTLGDDLAEFNEIWG